MDKYKLIFRGQLKEGKDQAAIGKFLCKFLGLAETNAEKLFSGRAYALKSNLPQQQAYDLQGKLDQAGILTDVIREKPLQNDVTYQEKVIQTKQGRERVAEPDYKMLVGDKTLCRHCGSHLSDASSTADNVSQQLKITPTVNVLSENHATKDKGEISVQNIDALDVSDWWKERFVILHKSGAGQKSIFEYALSPGIKLLPKSDSRKLLSMKTWIIGFFIGPLIYFFKGMHRKGFVLLLLYVFIEFIIAAIAHEFYFELNAVAYMLIGATIVHIFYIFDYYKFRVQSETFWPQLPKWMGNGVAIASSWFVTLGLYALWLTDYF